MGNHSDPSLKISPSLGCTSCTVWVCRMATSRKGPELQWSPSCHGTVASAKMLGTCGRGKVGFDQEKWWRMVKNWPFFWDETWWNTMIFFFLMIKQKGDFSRSTMVIWPAMGRFTFFENLKEHFFWDWAGVMQRKTCVWMIEHYFNQEKLDWVPSSERVRTTSKRTEPGVVHTYPGSCIGKVVATLGSE